MFLPQMLPEFGITAVCDGQQTACGKDFSGVKLTPQTPLLSFTPVKNSPTTTRCTFKFFISSPKFL